MVKKLGIALVLILAVLGGSLFWLHSNMDNLVKNAIEKYGSQMTGVKVRVASVKISPSQGTGILQGLVVGNPAGFKTPYALKVGAIEIALDVSSITKPVIHINRISVSSPDVIYEKSKGTTNFDAIQKHIAGNIGSSGARSSGGGSGKKLIVGTFSITNAKAQASAGFMNGRTVAVDLPDITLKNIGTHQGGVSPAELGMKVGSALKAKLGAAVHFDALAQSMGNAINKTKSAIQGFFGK
jgi:hypothetical protein